MTQTHQRSPDCEDGGFGWAHLAAVCRASPGASRSSRATWPQLDRALLQTPQGNTRVQGSSSAFQDVLSLPSFRLSSKMP